MTFFGHAKGRVYVSKWQDKRPVLMISTLNHPKLVETSNRYGRKLTKPEEIAIYNRFMSGIDRSDQMVSYYSSPRKTLRWYKKVFFHLLEFAVWNSYYIYKKYCQKNKKYEFITYRDDLIRKIIDAENLKPTDITHLAKHDNRMKERKNVPEFKPGSSRSYSGTNVKQVTGPRKFQYGRDQKRNQFF